LNDSKKKGAIFYKTLSDASREYDDKSSIKIDRVEEIEFKVVGMIGDDNYI
jgi:hypothetical protein